MRFLILDESEITPQNPRLYKEFLEQKGHAVAIHHTLLEAGGSDKGARRFLEGFDFVLASYSWPDSQLIQDEAKRRGDFRVIFYNVDWSPELDGRIVYHDFLDLESLEGLINPERRTVAIGH